MLKGLKYIGIVIGLFWAGSVCFAREGYLIVPVPDTIVAPTPIDQAIYTNTAEFFTPYIVNEINKTHYMHAPTITDVRNKIKNDYWLTKSAAKAMDDFRRYYILDFNFAKKMGNLYNTNLVLLLTSSLDANNYVMRRTWWTFFEVPGSSALDPAIKINIYGVLIDTDKNMIVWSKTYQKTISTVENRIVPIGYTPQTEQLQKFKDYSVYLAPRVAQSLQDTLLTASQKIAEPNMIHTDYGSIDNTFTKKYRTLRKEFKDATVIPAAKTRENYGKARAKYLEMKEQWEEDRAQKAIEKQNRPKKDKGIEPINFLWFKRKDAGINGGVNSGANITSPVNNAQPEIQQVSPVPANTAPVVSEDEPANVKNQENRQKEEVIQQLPQADSKESGTVQTTPENTGKATQSAGTKQAPAPAAAKSGAVTENTGKATQSVGTKQSPAPAAAKSGAVPEKVTPSLSDEKPAVNIITPDTDKKENIIKVNSKQKKQTGISNDELPVDALIYTRPTGYKPDSNYLPVKPRLREINIDDTVNSF